jgi:hypothetical protein
MVLRLISRWFGRTAGNASLAGAQPCYPHIQQQQQRLAVLAGRTAGGQPLAITSGCLTAPPAAGQAAIGLWAGRTAAGVPIALVPAVGQTCTLFEANFDAMPSDPHWSIGHYVYGGQDPYIEDGHLVMPVWSYARWDGVPEWVEGLKIECAVRLPAQNNASTIEIRLWESPSGADFGWCALDRRASNNELHDCAIANTCFYIDGMPPETACITQSVVGSDADHVEVTICLVPEELPWNEETSWEATVVLKCGGRISGPKRFTQFKFRGWPKVELRFASGVDEDSSRVAWLRVSAIRDQAPADGKPYCPPCNHRRCEYLYDVFASSHPCCESGMYCWWKLIAGSWSILDNALNLDGLEALWEGMPDFTLTEWPLTIDWYVQLRDTEDGAATLGLGHGGSNPRINVSLERAGGTYRLTISQDSTAYSKVIENFDAGAVHRVVACWDHNRVHVVLDPTCSQGRCEGFGLGFAGVDPGSHLISIGGTGWARARSVRITSGECPTQCISSLPCSACGNEPLPTELFVVLSGVGNLQNGDCPWCPRCELWNGTYVLTRADGYGPGGFPCQCSWYWSSSQQPSPCSNPAQGWEHAPRAIIACLGMSNGQYTISVHLMVADNPAHPVTGPVRVGVYATGPLTGEECIEWLRSQTLPVHEMSPCPSRYGTSALCELSDAAILFS